jgi:hypothetical protein
MLHVAGLTGCLRRHVVPQLKQPATHFSVRIFCCSCCCCRSLQDNNRRVTEPGLFTYHAVCIWTIGLAA